MAPRGRQARYRLMDTLLRVGGEAADRVAPTGRPLPVPPTALIVVFTPLHTRGALDAVALRRGPGRSVVATVIDAVELAGPAGAESERLARRLWSIERQRRVSELESLGVPVMIVPSGGHITPAIAALERARRRRARGGAHR